MLDLQTVLQLLKGQQPSSAPAQQPPQQLINNDFSQVQNSAPGSTNSPGMHAMMDDPMQQKAQQLQAQQGAQIPRDPWGQGAMQPNSGSAPLPPSPAMGNFSNMQPQWFKDSPFNPATQTAPSAAQMGITPDQQ